MNFEIITTERLVLRKLTPVEYNFIFENYSEEEIRKQLGLTTDQEFEKEKNKYIKGYSDYARSLIQFQLIDKSTNNFLGACGFHSWFAEHRRAEIGYALSKDEYKGKGLMTEALKPIIEYGFTKMNLNRMEACIGPNNAASLNLIKKFNFKQEGYLRQHYFRDNVLHDTFVFALLREEYF